MRRLSLTWFMAGIIPTPHMPQIKIPEPTNYFAGIRTRTAATWSASLTRCHLATSPLFLKTERSQKMERLAPDHLISPPPLDFGHPPLFFFFDGLHENEPNRITGYFDHTASQAKHSNKIFSVINGIK